MSQPANTPEPPRRCRLEHRLFSLFSSIVFRRAEDNGEPVMVVPLGEREAAVPLRSLQREFEIGPESEDGQVLALVAESLDFVGSLRPGDAFPTEVLTGEASWRPDAIHLQVAAARVRLQLVAWLEHDGVPAQLPPDAERLLAAIEQPERRRQVQQAFRKAAMTLGLANTNAVVDVVEQLAEELSYIEALRDRLLRRVETLCRRLGRLPRPDGANLDTLTRVQGLAAAALQEIRERFEFVDAQTADVVSALRNLASQQAFIRSHRDWLYRWLRRWGGLLDEWSAPGATDEALWALLPRTYHFLAQHFMPVTEWSGAPRPGDREVSGTHFTW